MSLCTIHSRFEARSRQQLHTVPILTPVLIWVRSGTKQMHTHGEPIRCPAGHCLVLPPVEARQMENIPAGNGLYRAEVFAPPRAWTERFMQRFGHLLPDEWQAAPSFACSQALGRQLEHLLGCQGEGELIAQRCELAWQGILLTLAEAGLGAPLFNLQPLSLTQRVHTLLRLDLARPWHAAEIAAQLGMSESTMRRGLRAEQSSFSQLLAKLRLIEAFGRVMCSSQPLQQIAYDCGFLSPSRFSQNFRHYYGMSPSELRASQQAEASPRNENIYSQ